jgi:hypothetical protein
VSIIIAAHPFVILTIGGSMTVHSEQKLIENDNHVSYQLIADLFFLFSRSAPLRILYSLRHKAMTLPDISKSLKMTQKVVLPELIEMRSTNILVSFSKSQQTYYRLVDNRILQVLDLIHKISQRKAEQAETKDPAHKISRIPQEPGNESVTH